MNGRSFSTGSVRDSIEGKPRLVMIPFEALDRIGQRFAFGAEKYGDWNAHLGQPVTVLVDSLLRHLSAFVQGVDDGEDHLAAVGWNAVMLLYVDEKIRRGEFDEGLDDRPRFRHDTPPPPMAEEEVLDIVQRLLPWYVRGSTDPVEYPSAGEFIDAVRRVIKARGEIAAARREANP